MISIDESCLKCFDNFLNFNASNHFVNKCVNKYHKRFRYRNVAIGKKYTYYLIYSDI